MPFRYKKGLGCCCLSILPHNYIMLMTSVLILFAALAPAQPAVLVCSLHSGFNNDGDDDEDDDDDDDDETIEPCNRRRSRDSSV